MPQKNNENHQQSDQFRLTMREKFIMRECIEPEHFEFEIVQRQRPGKRTMSGG